MECQYEDVQAGDGQLLSGQINLVDPGNLVGLLMQQFQSNVLVEVLDLLVPILTIQCLVHDLALLGMELSISRPVAPLSAGRSI